MTTAPQRRELGRLRWRCRRGMKELDQLLLGFLEHRYDAASAAERAAFETLLDYQDPRLWSLLSGRETSSDAAVAAVVTALSEAGRERTPTRGRR